MILGTISALISSGIYPLMFLMYGQVANVFVDFTKNKLNTTAFNQTNKWYFICFNSFIFLTIFI